MPKYVVTAPYVTVKTMTLQGVRIVGLYVNAPVPGDVDPGWIERHLEARMIAEVEDPAKVNAETSALERLDGVTGADKVAEQEAALNRSRAAEKAAETRKLNEAAAAREAKALADAKAKEDAGKPVTAKPPVK